MAARAQSRIGIMKRSTVLLLLLFFPRHVLGAPEVGHLSELSYGELLARKKVLEDGTPIEGMPAALALAAAPPETEIAFKGLHKRSRGKIFHEDDYEEDKGHVHKQKDEHKMHDILNTSIMALSYLAFGGYLLCMIANALREKRRQIVMTYPTVPTSTQFAHVFQQYLTHRPTRPFIKFPAVTLHQGRRKRRRRSSEGKESVEGPSSSTSSVTSEFPRAGASEAPSHSSFVVNKSGI